VARQPGPSPIRALASLQTSIPSLGVDLADLNFSSTDVPLHVSDDGLATLVHVHMFDPDSLRAAVPQAA
jgi:hypothetical protein